MKRWKPLGEESEEFLAFPILAALARRPMTQRELSHTFQLSDRAVKRRLARLEELGFIVQRLKDFRWVMVVRLMAVGVPAPSGVPGVTVGAAQKPVRDEVVLGRVVLEPLNAPGSTQQGGDAVPVTPAPSEGSTRRVAAVAERFGVPESFEDLGEACVGTIGRCITCRTHTPLRFGATHLCPTCARVWRESDVQNEAR